MQFVVSVSYYLPCLLMIILIDHQSTDDHVFGGKPYSWQDSVCYTGIIYGTAVSNTYFLFIINIYFRTAHFLQIMSVNYPLTHFQWSVSDLGQVRRLSIAVFSDTFVPMSPVW